ncbi:MAG: hypothetical protein ABL949_16175 [Fimbriimonadaceae bacterium]
MSELAKIRVQTDEGIAVHRYLDHFDLQEFSSFKRLIVGPSEDPIGIAIECAQLLQGPFRFSYVLAEPVPIEGYSMGRFEMLATLEISDLEGVLRNNKRFFELDARHHLWIAGKDGVIVYDQHDVLFLYGPLLEFEKVLLARGLTPGPVEFPYPHTHYYHDEFNPNMIELLGSGDWKWQALDDHQDVYR